MKLLKKNTEIFVFLTYIIINILFYNTAFKEYPNIILFTVSFLLCILEILFWISLFSLLDNSDITDRARYIEYAFLISISGIGISRIFLYSSPYLNDLLNTRYLYIYIIGLFRVVFIFTSIMNIFYMKDSKSKTLFIVSFLNFINSILIWLDFDNNINAVIRIIIGILMLIYVIILEVKNMKTGIKEE
mgnify:CR=1 FL=1